ncbi:MAG: ATP-binding protein [Proteobacteria bacterium]|nr:ATP-binding protein [Pseudomonadota bacterium]
MLREASEIDRALIATIVSELAANLYRYAGRGVIRVCRHDQQGCVDIDVLATDNGPGIADIDRAMSDHFSTGGTLGLGLPGVRRMADHFWLRSSAHQGTQVCARKRIVGTPLRPGMAPAPAAFAAAGIPEQVKVPAPQTPQPWESGVSLRPCQGFLVSGDRTLCLPLEQGVLFGIIDASGHGPYADAIAAQLERLFMEKGTPYLEQLMHCFADALKGSLARSFARRRAGYLRAQVPAPATDAALAAWRLAAALDRRHPGERLRRAGTDLVDAVCR